MKTRRQKLAGFLILWGGQTYYYQEKEVLNSCHSPSTIVAVRIGFTFVLQGKINKRSGSISIETRPFINYYLSIK